MGIRQVDRHIAVMEGCEQEFCRSTWHQGTVRHSAMEYCQYECFCEPQIDLLRVMGCNWIVSMSLNTWMTIWTSTSISVISVLVGTPRGHDALMSILPIPYVIST